MKSLLSKATRVMVAIDAANLNIGLRRYGKAADIKKLKQCRFTGDEIDFEAV